MSRDVRRVKQVLLGTIGAKNRVQAMVRMRSSIGQTGGAVWQRH
jgi:hypothetical protein